MPVFLPTNDPLTPEDYTSVRQQIETSLQNARDLNDVQEVCAVITAMLWLADHPPPPPE